MNGNEMSQNARP